jgi:hypothetical protein
LALSHPSSSAPFLPSPIDEQEEDSRSRQAPPLLAFILAAFFGVIIFLPPEGRIGVPLHDGLVVLLGRAAYLLPVALVFAGVLLVVRAVRPSVPLPWRRLVGTGLLALGVLPSEYLLGSGESSTGLVGHWLSTWLLELVGGPATTVVLVIVLGLGALLAFDIRLLRVAPLVAAGPWKDAES